MIGKALNFQTKNFVSFLIGYIQESIISSLVNRLLVQSLLPVFLMKRSEQKRANLKADLRSEEVRISLTH
jgi:hypothetical protein